MRFGLIVRMFDIVIIGGGINGAGIARDAAGRGLSVLLCEKDDLAAHTSSSSTKLVHGGLRYLEFYDFALVRKALKEREVLLRAAPHIIWPMRFVLPHQKGQRPAWLVRLGLFLYDYMGGRKLLPPTKVLRRPSSGKFAPLKDELKLAFEYSDCWVEDSRLVVLNAVDAARRGATVLTRSPCTGLTRHTDHWDVAIGSGGGTGQTVQAKTVVNASGPWVDDIAGLADPSRTVKHVRLVKGSHIVTRKLFEGEHSYFFQNADGRIIFAIPYERGTRTLIGTTDVPFDADKDHVEISDEEVDYLCAAASEYFAKPVTPEDIVSTYSGVRPLYDDHAEDASEVTRDYVLSYEDKGGAPILSVFGGKITTFRKLAEGALKVLEKALGELAEPWTEQASLPGGDIPGADFDGYEKRMSDRYGWLDGDVLHRLLRAYGTEVAALLGDASSMADLGKHYGSGLYQAELDYLVAHEFALSGRDVLWRRSKLGLHMTDDEISAVETFFAG